MVHVACRIGKEHQCHACTVKHTLVETQLLGRRFKELHSIVNIGKSHQHSLAVSSSDIIIAIGTQPQRVVTIRQLVTGSLLQRQSNQAVSQREPSSETEQSGRQSQGACNRDRAIRQAVTGSLLFRGRAVRQAVTGSLLFRDRAIRQSVTGSQMTECIYFQVFVCH